MTAKQFKCVLAFAFANAVQTRAQCNSNWAICSPNSKIQGGQIKSLVALQRPVTSFPVRIPIAAVPQKKRVSSKAKVCEVRLLQAWHFFFESEIDKLLSLEEACSGFRFGF